MIKQINKKLNVVLIVLIAIFLYTCDNTSSHSEEYEVFSSQINSLIDATLVDTSNLLIPSPNDFKDSISKRNFKERSKISSNKESMPLKVILKDSIYPLNDLVDLSSKVKQMNSKDDYSFVLKNDCESLQPYTINIAGFKIDKSKYNLIRYSEYNEKEGSNNPAIYSLSRICFNEKNNLGVFKVSIIYSGLNAYGVIVFIKKEKDEWIIDQIIEDWVS